jgi:cytidine deaminase
MSKKIEVNIILEQLSPEEWSVEEKILINKAKEILEKAHAPYSDFLVGAALLLENGEIFVSNNQENVSFPIGICAERAVLGYAMGNHPDSRPIKIAIAAKRRKEASFATVTPCGMCRQTINEYEPKFGQPIEVLMLTSDGEMLKAKSIEQLLPFRFNDLKS